MWKLKGQVLMTDVGNHFYVVRFNKKEDYEHVLYGGPWMMADHYLTVRRWTPAFNPFTTGFQKVVI